MMNSELSLDYRFAVNSPADAHRAQVLNDMMEQSHNPMRMECIQNNVPYSGQLQMRASRDMELMEVKLDSQADSHTLFTVERSRSHIARNLSFAVHVVIWMEGDNRLSWGDCTHTLQAGDLFVMDTDTPYTFQVMNRGHGYSLALPKCWDSIGDTRMENIIGNIIPRLAQRNSGVLDYVRQLSSRPDVLNAPDTAEKLHDILSMALNPRAKSEHQTGLLTLMRNYIDIFCISPDLAPSNVAATFGISVRYLHQLFATSDTSFSEYLVAQRLQRAQRMLAETHYRKETILNIAMDCGFRDINHFGRRFRARFGVTPSDYRQVHQNVQT